MHLQLERSHKCGVQVNFKCIEFLAASRCTGKQLRLDPALRGLNMFDNYCIDHNTFNNNLSFARDDFKGFFYTIFITSKKRIS